MIRKSRPGGAHQPKHLIRHILSDGGVVFYSNTSFRTVSCPQGVTRSSSNEFQTRSIEPSARHHSSFPMPLSHTARLGVLFIYFWLQREWLDGWVDVWMMGKREYTLAFGSLASPALKIWANRSKLNFYIYIYIYIDIYF